jgi:hypothetical protein
MALSAEQKKIIALAKARQRQATQQSELSGQQFKDIPVTPQVQSFLRAARSDVPLERRELLFKQQLAKGLPEQAAIEQALFPTTLSEGAEFAAGIPGAIPAVVSGAVSEPLAGLAGLGAAAIPGGRTGAEQVEATREALTIPPIGQAAQETLQTLGKELQPVAQAPRRAGEFAQDLGAPPWMATTIETGITAIPEAFGAGRFMRAPAQVRKVDEISEPVRQAQEVASEMEVDLFDFQKTLDPQKTREAEFMQQLSSGADKAAKALKTQNAQVSDAVDRVLAKIAPDDALQVGPRKFRDAAQRAIDAKKEIRREKTSPLYNEAFNEAKEQNLKVDVSDIRDEFSVLAQEFPEKGKIRTTIDKAVGFLDSDDLKKLHNAKMELDELIESRGEGSLGNVSKRNVVEIKNRLIDRIAEASPRYDEARAAFAELSPGVRELNESIIGNIANISDADLKRVSRRMFDPEETNVSVIMKAKEIIKSSDPDAWDMLLRSEIERRMGTIKPGVPGDIENLPAKLSNAIFGNQKNRKAILASADGDTKKALQSLDDVLGRASRGRIVGSPTASRAEIAQELREGRIGFVRDLFRKPVDLLVSTGEDAAFNNRVSSLTDALFDTRYQKDAIRYINSGRSKDFVGLLAKIEASKAAAREQKEE